MFNHGGWMAVTTVMVFMAVLVFQALAYTDDHDVQVLQAMYRALNCPSQLDNWKLDGGDPCGESWNGVACNGSSVIHIKLQGLELRGHLGIDLAGLTSLKHLDLSFNNIEGAIPHSLPLDITHLNLAWNALTQNIPYSLPYLKHLRHLNVSHNLLSGPLGDVFGGLVNLKEMDLSDNNFTGDLPTSFGSLTNLTKLFLQGNKFTGSVILLADLQLTDLNIEDNYFSGVIPESFQLIPNLWIWGNRFDKGENYPPWKFPLDQAPNVQNITSPPTTESSAIKKFPPPKVVGHKKKGLSAAGIASIVVGLTLLAVCATLFFVINCNRSHKPMLSSLEGSEASLHSMPTSLAKEFCSRALEDSPFQAAVDSPPLISPWQLPPVRTKTVKVSRRSFSKKYKIAISAKVYTTAELQSATNSFSEENLLGEGSLGSVYRAEFPNGQVLAVKNVKTVQLSLNEEEQFLDAVRTVSRLRHPNVVTLIGYCVEHGQHLLVYEYIRNLSLDDALHCPSYIPLSWGIRLRIALDVARGLDYLHTSCVPPVTHSNLKAANILIDEDLKPRICDCGLAILRPLTSNAVKLKASEMAIADGGYIAPEHVQTALDNSKADVYAFGVLLLELFTGRRPFDSSRQKAEQSLVNWAANRLHDSASLIQMVDPAIRRTISSKALSNFADIISLCIQPEKEFRPPMSEIVASLMRLQPKAGSSEAAAEGSEIDPLDRSFRSTNSGLVGSPTVSYYSV